MKNCSKCNEEKPEEEFSWKSKKNNVRASMCKECHKAYSKAHYLDNTDMYKAKSKISSQIARERNREYVKDYLNNHPCVDCGETDIQVLEFDHIEMLKCVGGRVSGYMTCSLSRLKKEIAKCEVRCGNCHIRRTRLQMGWFR